MPFHEGTRSLDGGRTVYDGELGHHALGKECDNEAIAGSVRDGLVPARRPADNVDELAGNLAEDPWRSSLWQRLAEHRQRRALAPLPGRVPVLDPAAIDSRDVARRPDRWVARPVVGIGMDAVVGREPGAVSQLGSRHNTDTRNAEGVVQALVTDPRTVRTELRHRRSSADRHAAGLEAITGPSVKLLAERAGPQAITHFEDRRAQAKCRKARRDLDTDEPAADDGHPSAVAGVHGHLPEAPCVGKRPQQERVIAAFDGQLTRPGSGRDQGPLERDARAICERRLACLQVERGDTRLGENIHLSALVPTPRLGPDELIGQIVAKQLLAQWRTVVGQIRLVADNEDRTLETLPPQRPGTPNRCNPTADEQDIGVCRAWHDGMLDRVRIAKCRRVGPSQVAFEPAWLDSAPMSPPDALQMREASMGDIPSIAALRVEAGWAAHEWALHAVIGKPSARCVVVADADGGLAGVGSGIAYPPLGFIGNMVVADAHRRRGVGTAILDDVAGWLTGADCTRLELNATDEGQHLYARHGFASRGASSVARVPRSAPTGRDPTLRTWPANKSDRDPLSAYDRPRFGGDRSAILALLLADPSCRTAIAERDGTIAGFVVARLDEPRLGPLVADEPVVASSLLKWAFEALPTTDALRLNLPPGNDVGAAWLRTLGATMEKWDGRMARGPDVPRRDDTIYQMTVGPLG